ncbi:hypothetical protein [Planktothrix mougeotii]|uniref:Uncharacterized protein n=1 Tax=Planktothrix mougeotii LEGE 06226 TaxID=1828728 RepID=A0ABR9UFB0_9CYAN|nr:hypothetical protein [Planktothrix mougeotii]MBE9144511.1 hypothetical protein [Planktothrix mougeotii LEGE 06226]
MAVTLSKTDYKRLKVLTIQLQALIREISQKGAILDEMMEILQTVKLDTDKPEVIANTRVFRSPIIINPINIERIKAIQKQLAEIRESANVEGFDSTIQRQKELIIKNIHEIKPLFFERKENFELKQDIAIFEAVEVNGISVKMASKQFNISEDLVNYAVNRARVKLVIFLLGWDSERISLSA